MLSVAPQGKTSEKIKLSQTNDIPILNDFFQYLKQRSTSDVNPPSSHKDTTEEQDDKTKNSLSPLEHPSTILTEGHHQRYKELLQIFGPLASQDAFSRLSYQNQISRKREWNVLKDMVTNERLQYSMALEKFKHDHVHRFHIGFKVPAYISHFARMKAEYIDQYKHKWLSSKIRPPLYYGTSVQNIYLEQNVRIDLSNLDAFAPKVLLRKRIGDGSVCTVSVNTLKRTLAGSKLNKTTVQNHLESPALLCEDESAKLLVIEHGIDVVMTVNALESILRSKEWNLPVLPIDNTVFVEDPVPTPTGPRECLSYGLTKGLMQQIMLAHSKTGTTDTLCGEFYYTTFTLKNRGNSTKVLVRSFVSLEDDSGNPILLDCNPNYFSDLGEEEPSGNDRAYWLIQKLLLPDSTLLSCSIDVETCLLGLISEKRIADALETNETITAEKGIGTLGVLEDVLVGTTLEHSLQTLTNVLSGMAMIEKAAEYFLVILSDNMNGIASVHKSNKDYCNDLIDIRNIFRDSVNVFQNLSWLVTHEYRQWKWNHKRIPYSFPFQHTIGVSSKKL
jgi:hypothetical protein